MVVLSLLKIGFPSRHFEDDFLCDGKPYSYKPLDPDSRTIRLLRITRGRPGIYENKFGAKLVEVSLDSLAFKYLATSYTWGTGQAVRRVYALPMGNGQQLCISKQILCIFRTVLKPGRTIHLRIDAICIYIYRHGKKPLKNLRFGTPFSEGFLFPSRISKPLLSAFATPCLFLVSIHVSLL